MLIADESRLPSGAPGFVRMLTRGFTPGYSRTLPSGRGKAAGAKDPATRRFPVIVNCPTESPATISTGRFGLSSRGYCRCGPCPWYRQQDADDADQNNIKKLRTVSVAGEDPKQSHRDYTDGRHPF